MHPRNFGSQKIVCTEYVCTYVHPLRKPGWNFEFQVPAHFGPKKQQQSHFFYLTLMSTLAWISEKELEPEII